MNINDLVNVQISLSRTGIAGESFQNILIVGSAPATPPATAPAEVGTYTSLAEITAAGWASTEAIYKAAAIAFANGAAKVVIAVRQEVSEVQETIDKTLDRAKLYGGWYGFTVLDAVSGEYTTITTWADANEKLFGFTADVSSAVTNPYGTSALRALGITTKSIAEHPNNAYAHVAWMAVCMQYAEGAETWAYKELAGITADEYSSTEQTAIETAGMNFYTTCAGANITLAGKTVSGEWIDIIRFRDWLKNKIQVNVFNLLAGSPKVPYTSDGIAMVQSAIESALITGQKQGGVAQAEFDANGNEVAGYTVTMPTMADVTAEDKQNRILRNCRFSARLAGAIHVVEIKGTLVA